jgi:hypothetical protein
MKKLVNIAFATYVTLAGFSYLNAADAPAEVDARLVRGCKDVQEKVFCCPLELPGFYKINPAQLGAFLDAFPPAKEFYTDQAGVAAATKLSDADRANLTIFQTAQVIAQAYFRGTGEKDYVCKIPFVAGREDAVLAAAQATGLVTITAPLEAYKTYMHLAATIEDKRTLVLGCGNASLNDGLYALCNNEGVKGVPNYYMYDCTGFVSSGCYCNHDAHVTVARTPGILPTIVADIFDPAFQAGLLAAAKTIGGFEVIIDEHVLMGMGIEKKEAGEGIEFFKSLLAKDGKLIACEYPGFKVL